MNHLQAEIVDPGSALRILWAGRFAMKYGIIRFYEELNDFLPKGKRRRDIEWSFSGERSVKDLIESFHVPHSEVDLVLVNGKPVEFNERVSDGDRISVYPVFELVNISKISPLRNKPLRNPSFICDVHLGTLTKKLRLLGFDTVFDPSLDDPDLVNVAQREKRILLTSDRYLLMRKNLTRGVFIRPGDVNDQLEYIMNRLDLFSLADPFTRCLACNGTLNSFEKGGRDYLSLSEKIPPKVKSRFTEYSQCECCGRVYWKGTHYEKLLAFVKEIEERK